MVIRCDEHDYATSSHHEDALKDQTYSTVFHSFLSEQTTLIESQMKKEETGVISVVKCTN